MKKFLNHRVLPFVCALSILVSFMVVPASAHFGGSVDAELPTIDPVAFFDKDLMASEMNRLFGDNSNDRCAFFSEFAYIVNKDNWTETSRDALVELAFYWNSTLGPQYSSTASVDTHRLDDGTEISYVRVTISDSRLGGSRNNWTWCLNDGAGKILVDLPDVEKTIVNRGQWLPLNQTSNTRVEMKPYDEMFNAAKDLGCSLYRVGNYWVIKQTGGIAEYIFCNENCERFVARYDEDMWASEQDRPTDKVTENGDIIEGDLIDNSVNLDLEGMTMLLPGGTLALIDKVIYDESTKSYHIDSHDTYNYTINNYYTWNYYINYTSITYIGQTEEYNKYYEVYYELPDGRSSADLTKEDLEQLNLSVDVIPYGRSADDTSLRSLYHFDGDTKDSSYWNYCTDFTWNKGASLTYMDAGVFDGALYLDETEHDFSLKLPSGIYSDDFTLQFRYYQSATAAPQTDSYLQIGGTTFLQFNGSQILNASGSVLSSMPIGSWNELAVIRSGSVVYFYLNGIRIGSVSAPSNLTDVVFFHFGSAQQTFKYLDELRFLNYALVSGGSSYECTSVPHDTNLSLVLPGSAVPVADEYWKKTSSHVNLLESSGYDTWAGESLPSFAVKTTVPSQSYGSNWWDNGFNSYTNFYPKFEYYSAITTVNSYADSMSIVSKSYKEAVNGRDVPLYLAATDSGQKCYGRTYGLVSCFGLRKNSGSSHLGLTSGTFTLSMADMSGNVGSLTFTVPEAMSQVYSGYQIQNEVEFNGYLLSAGVYRVSSTYTAFLVAIQPTSYDTVNPFMYLELVEGDSTDLSFEKVTSVTVFDVADLQTPTLAVRTDIDITSYQIGGVRPSLPEKGMVWAMVENERITSLQVYNGQAWEGVDGRIWTGERWIPMNAYNIITLQDMYDIVDATPNYEYIYSEAGFWSWWQKSWNAFTEKLFLTLGSGAAGGGASGGAGSSELNKVDLDSAPVVSDPEQEDSKSLWQFIILVVDGGKSVVTGTRQLFSGVVSTIPVTMDNITGAFDSGGIAVGILDGSDPDAADLPDTVSDESEVLDPWRYR